MSERQVRLDANGKAVVLTREQAESLRDRAALEAASSATLRDVSLLLQGALEIGRVVVLQRHELRALAELLDAADEPAAAALRDALRRA